MATPAAADTRFDLPESEKMNYRKLNKAMDDKEYKKGLVIADGILAKAPLASAVVAMKGLCLYYSDRMDGDDGAMAVLKAGLKDNFKSASLWHALGCVHKGERDDAQALACYKRAFQFDETKTTHAIVRDVTATAIQMRDWATYLDIRQKALAAKSNVRYNWVTYAIAHHMLGNIKMAQGIMDVLGMIMEFGEGAIETSEIHLYRAQLAILCNQPKDAISILTKETTVDNVARLQLLGKANAMHTAKNSKEQSEKAYQELYALCIDERDTLYRLAELRGITVGPLPKRVIGQRKATPVAPSPEFTALLDEMRDKYPRSDPPKRLALDYCPIDQFEQRLRDYCRPMIAKMVPSLTSVLKTLYASPERAEIIAKVFHAWEATLAAGEGAAEFSEAAPRCAMPDPSKPNPQWLLFVLQTLSSHYYRLGDYDRAHEYIDKAIEHTPTVEMLHIMRAKIFDRQGKRAEAALHGDIGRKLDLQDRFVNTKAAKYYLRNGDVEAAEAVIGCFLKIKKTSEVFYNMCDMQASWYEIELGNAYMLRDDYVNAIAAFKLIEKHYLDNHDELLDYHAYTLRRCNVRAFLEVIENDDAPTQQKQYLKMCPKMIRAYLKVQEIGVDEAMRNFTPRENPVEDEELMASMDTPAEKTRLEKLVKDFGVNENSLQLDNPLAACEPYVKAMQKGLPTSPVTHELAFEVAIRSMRPVLAAAALKALAELPETESTVASLKPRLADFISKHHASGPIAAAVQTVL